MNERKFICQKCLPQTNIKVLAEVPKYETARCASPYDAVHRSTVDMICLDIQIAFDSVPHKGLLKKIKCLGIDRNIYKWI